MPQWADYVISKASYFPLGGLDSVEIREDLGESLSCDTSVLTRSQLSLYITLLNKTFVTITKDERKSFWSRGLNVRVNLLSNSIVVDNSPFDNLGNIPLLLPKRKTFISYHHDNDQYYKELFENLTEDLIINKSVGKDDIDIDNSSDYIKQLIQGGYLNDTSVCVVLVGSETRTRRHVDWEISGALDFKVGNSYAGLLGILLPSHPDYGMPNYYYRNLPRRLAANAQSGYALICSWTKDMRFIQDMIEEAFSKRESSSAARINRTIPQMQRNGS